jgi:uncharacterized protein (TIGR00369 family)
MENQRLKFVQSFAGKQFTGSPSPFANWLSGKVISASEEWVEFEFAVRKEMTNPVGMLHGGVISGMIDECMGVNFMCLGLEYFYPTISLNVDFFNAVKEGEKVIVRSQVIKKGKTIINIKATVLNESLRLVAQASSNLAASDIKILF